jgi:hypothetical protein
LCVSERGRRRRLRTESRLDATIRVNSLDFNWSLNLNPFPPLFKKEGKIAEYFCRNKRVGKTTKRLKDKFMKAFIKNWK